MRGSEWRKWDLHVHSPFSNLNNNYNCTIQDFANKILAENIAVIGLTNYFFISKQEIDDVKNALAGRCLVIPNIEFRINDKNKDNEFINYHVLFNPQIDITKVHQTLARLKLNNLRADNIYCTPENLATYGYASVTVSFDDLYKILHNDFKEGDDFVLVGPFKGYGGFCPDNKERNINLATKLDQKSSIIFSKKEDSDFFLNTVGKRHIYNLLAKPVIYCSDAHTINDIGKNFTWIKADITFEGFKQIIYEPEHRVRIQADKPDEKDARLIIDKIQFVTEDNRFTTKEIFLNENLNVIIGGKSSGKSILLYNIAKTLLPDRTDRSVLKYKNPDTNTYQYKYNFENFDFKVTLKSGAEQSVSRKDDESSILPEIKYIPQNYLSELAEKKYKKGNELNKLVRELLLEDKKFEAIYDSFLHKVKNNDSARENLINSFFDIKANLKDLKLALGKMGNIDAIKDSIKVNEELIEKLKAELGLSDDEMTRYNELVARQQKLNFDITQIYNDYQKVVNYNDELKSMINDQVSRKEFFLSTLTTQSIKDFYKDRYSTIEELKSLIENISIELGVDESNSFFKDNIITQQLNPLQTELSHINEELKKYLKSIEIKDKILKLEKDILDDKERLNAIEQKNAEIELKRAAVKDDYRKIFDLYDQNYQEYVNLIEHFRERVKHLEDKSLTITGSVRLNIKKFRENMFRISNGISKSYKDFEIVVGTNNNTEFNYEEVKAQLQSIFKLMYNEKYVLVRNVDYKSAIKDLMKDYFFDHWEVSSLNDTLYNMSTGKASFVILKLIVGLSKSPGPLLIDQPEDNLDNRSITTDLITYLQDKKVQRQIIIVTHNPNIVVNADSENIVVAHQYGQNEDENDSELQFDYINGSLENSFEKNNKKDILKSMGVKEHIAEIVEGGKEAFQKRERKYRFSKN